jgi:hypothetical protein
MIFGKIPSQLSLLADDCIIYWKILSNNDVENLQIDLNRLEMTTQLKVRPFISGKTE